MTSEQGSKIIARSEYVRPLLALLVVIVVPLLVFIALGRAGYALSDYPTLIRNGRLSWTKQVVGWVGFGMWLSIYCPVALKALKNPVYLAVDGAYLVGPFEMPIPIQDIRAISLKRGLFHKFLTIERRRRKHRLPITYVSGGMDTLKDALRSEPKLSALLVSS